jgi:hypothetical protein
LKAGLDWITTHADTAHGKRWETAVKAIDLLNGSSTEGSKHGVLYDVTNAQDAEAKAISEDAGTTDLKEGHPYTWKVKVAVNSKGDPEIKYNVNKGSTSRNASSMSRVRYDLQWQIAGVGTKLEGNPKWVQLWNDNNELRNQKELNEVLEQEMLDQGGGVESDVPSDGGDTSCDDTGGSDFDDARVMA